MTISDGPIVDESTLGVMLFEREWRKCAPDWDTSTVQEKYDAFVYWAEKYVYITHPKGSRKFELYDSQKDTVYKWLEHRFTLALKARQIGFSTLVAVFVLWLCYFYSDREILLISRTEELAKKLLRPAKYAIRRMPKWMQDHGPKVTATAEKLTFGNGSLINSLPSQSDPARGFTGFLIVVDELGQLPNSQDAWASIEPVADVGGSILMLGTANGQGNLFYDLWRDSKGEWTDLDGRVWKEGTGKNRFVNVFQGWWGASHRDVAWYNQQREELPEWQLHQEYPSNPTEAFVKSGRPVFDFEMLRSHPYEEPLLRGWVSTDGQWHDDRGGPLRIWAPPIEGHRYALGADVAEGLEWGDYSSIHVVDAANGEVVAHWHGHVDPDLFGVDVIAPLSRHYHKALTLVEVNNHGMSTLKALRRINHFPIYRQRRHSSRSNKQTDADGWRTTITTKPLAVDELNKALRDHEVLLHDEETMQELATFVRDEAGRMNGSPHDDRVMSLAIAVQGLHYVHLREYKEEQAAPPGSMGWHKQFFNKEQEKKARTSPIGATAVRTDW